MSENEKTAAILRDVAENGTFGEYCIAIDPTYQLEWFHREIAHKLEAGYRRLLKGESVRLMIFMPPRHGKELANSTPILSTKGWTTHGELRVGDQVYHPLGYPVDVVAVADQEHDDDYVVELTNGEKIRCHANHEWTVYDRSIGKLATYETNYFVKRTKFGLIKQVISAGRSIYQLPDTGCIEYPAADLPLEPYFLGAWLGDGTSTASTIVASPKDPEPILHIVSLGFKVTFEATHKTTGVISYGFGRQDVTTRLRQLGCFIDKNIPEAYLRSSKRQRLELLAGLIDTDGHVEAQSGRVRISTASKALRDGILDLATTLGFRPYVVTAQPTTSSSGIVGRKEVYQVCFQPAEEIPTHIPRKKITRFAPRRAVGIKSVTYEPNGERGRCITVDSPDGLYLAGRALIPTHNSDMATQKFPSWILGKHPDLPVMVSSYSDELATDFGQNTRAIMQSDQYAAMFPTRLRADAKAKGKWLTEQGGGYTAVGVGGALTGRGFKIGIVDDPFKNREEADSPVVRESRHKWFQSTFYTRQEGASMIIFILTRWHEDDLAGRVLREAREAKRRGEAHDEWDVIEYKAIADTADAHRQEGEALWPGKFDLAKLLTIKSTVGSYEFSALYQQTPVDEENRKFKQAWFKYRELSDVQEKETYNVMTIDPRGADDIKIGKDYVGICINFVDSEGKWNVLCYRQKLSGTELIDLIFTAWKRYGLHKIWIEDNQFTQGLLVSINEQINVRHVYPYIELAKTGGVQKELRIEALVPRYERGGIYHITISGQNQCEDLETELALFPKSTNDDASDALAHQTPIAVKPGDDYSDIPEVALPGGVFV